MLPFVAWYLVLFSAHLLTDSSWTPFSPDGHPDAQIFISEMLITLSVVSVFLNAINLEFEESNQYYGLAIGLALLAGRMCFEDQLDPTVNPAAATGIALAWGGSSLSQLWLYWVGPLVGSLVALSVFWVTNFSTAVYEYNYLR